MLPIVPQGDFLWGKGEEVVVHVIALRDRTTWLQSVEFVRYNLCPK